MIYIMQVDIILVQYKANILCVICFINLSIGLLRAKQLLFCCANTDLFKQLNIILRHISALLIPLRETHRNNDESVGFASH